ncbi:hypothetical protein N0V84_010514 [Fusarium piperis]|uniref:DUF1857 family protein n=1 Tax=Fusarium piperis TaxID=1435070 RepID=A0A9W8W4J2_9HYPO|nr:hypothetical protein N0V84_010514 [Fusarium piperis]
MVRAFGAGTLPVNGPNDKVKLTRSQLWQALQRKIRKPEEFAPPLSDCKVLKDENGVVLRTVTLTLPPFGQRFMTETVTSHGDLWVSFAPEISRPGCVRTVAEEVFVQIKFTQAEGSISTNLVSFDDSLSEDSLWLTYTFEWEWPEVQKDTPEYDELTKAMSEASH